MESILNKNDTTSSNDVKNSHSFKLNQHTFFPNSMALAKMDSDHNPTLSQAHPETMDFLSNTWCNFAVQALHPQSQERSLVLHDSSIKSFESDMKPHSVKNNTPKLDDGDKFLPSWKANDIKSWIWMQQAMHPEVNYSSYFKRKWMSWKIAPFKQVSIKKWMKEIKQRRKEEQRLEKAEVHAAISVAGVAAALAAIAAENSQDGSKESAIASAAALVAAQCAKVAEAMGAKRGHLTSVIGSAITGTASSEILALTAAAATSAIRGADTLKGRSACKNRLNGTLPVLPLEDGNENDFNFEKCREVLAKGADLNIEMADGRYLLRSVAVILNNEGKVVLKMKNLNMLHAFARQKESIVLDWHAELYKDSEGGGDAETGYLVVLSTNKGMVKLDMMNDYECYRTWSMTINHMLMLSTTFTKYELQFYKG